MLRSVSCFGLHFVQLLFTVEKQKFYKEASVRAEKADPMVSLKIVLSSEKILARYIIVRKHLFWYIRPLYLIDVRGRKVGIYICF